MQRENLLLKWLVSAVAIWFTAWLLPTIEINDFGAALWVSIVLGLINVLVKPFLALISLPLIVFTAGLFLLVINAVALSFADELVDSFYVKNFWAALLGSIIISLISSFLNAQGNNQRRNGPPPNRPNY